MTLAQETTSQDFRSATYDGTEFAAAIAALAPFTPRGRHGYTLKLLPGSLSVRSDNHLASWHFAGAPCADVLPLLLGSFSDLRAIAKKLGSGPVSFEASELEPASSRLKLRISSANFATVVDAWQCSDEQAPADIDAHPASGRGCMDSDEVAIISRLCGPFLGDLVEMPALSNVRLRTVGSELVADSTDRHVAAIARGVGVGDFEGEAFMPGGLCQLSRSGPIIFIKHENGACFRRGQLHVESWPGAQFPNIDRVIPDYADAFKLRFSPSDLAASVRAVMPVAKNASNRVRFLVDGARLKVSAHCDSEGMSGPDVSLQVPSSEPIKFAMNGRYVLDALAGGSHDFIAADWNAGSTGSLNRPAVFSSDSGRTLAVVMPMSCG